MGGRGEPVGRFEDRRGDLFRERGLRFLRSLRIFLFLIFLNKERGLWSAPRSHIFQTNRKKNNLVCRWSSSLIVHTSPLPWQWQLVLYEYISWGGVGGLGHPTNPETHPADRPKFWRFFKKSFVCFSVSLSLSLGRELWTSFPHLWLVVAALIIPC